MEATNPMFATASQRAALEHRIAGYAASSIGQLSAVVDPSRETAVHTARAAALNDGPLTPACGDGTLAKASSAQTTAANSRSEPTENGTTDSDSGCGGHQSHAGGDDAVQKASPSTLAGSLFAARVVGRLLRVKARQAHERLGHTWLAKRLGLCLLVISVLHVAVAIVVGIRGMGGLLCLKMTAGLSKSAFLLHTGLTLPSQARFLLCSHYVVLVIDGVVRGVFSIIWEEYSWAVYHLVGWCLCFYPLGGWGLQRFIGAVQALDQTTRDKGANSAIIAFTGCSLPILYFALNGLLCVGFSSDPGQYCDTRVSVNYTAIVALVANAMVFFLLTLQPVALEQITALDLSRPQFIGFCFLCILLLVALALHSQNETFAPEPPAIGIVAQVSDICLLLFLVSFAVSIFRMSNEKSKKKSVDRGTGGISDSALDGPRVDGDEGKRSYESATDDPPVQGVEKSKGVTDKSAPIRTTKYGAMLLHRTMMVSFTTLYVASEACSVGRAVRFSFIPLSFAAASFHVWVTMEKNAVGWSETCHYLAHVSGSLMYGLRVLRDDGLRYGVITLSLVVTFYPAVFAVLVRFRNSVHAHGGYKAAAECTAVSFTLFWGAVPTMLYLGADSIGSLDLAPRVSPCRRHNDHVFSRAPSGCALRQDETESCTNRVDANTIGAWHIGMASALWIILTNSEGGAGFNLLAAMRLELSWVEVVAASFATIASMLALFSFATRESDKQAVPSIYVATAFNVCWFIAALTLGLNTEKAHESRQRRNRHRRRSDMPATTVVLPHSWSGVFISLSFFSYTLPQAWRFAFRFEGFRGTIIAFSNLCFVAHLLMLVTQKRSAARRIGAAHLFVQLAGIVCEKLAVSRNAGVEFAMGDCIVQAGAACFEYCLWTRLIQPMLASGNPKLHDELPLSTFRWLFQKGGLMMRCVSLSWTIRING